MGIREPSRIFLTLIAVRNSGRNERLPSGQNVIAQKHCATGHKYLRINIVRARSSAG
jgi:hypothetical protein